jgi:hypothetical protein
MLLSICLVPASASETAQVQKVLKPASDSYIVLDKVEFTDDGNSAHVVVKDHFRPECASQAYTMILMASREHIKQ